MSLKKNVAKTLLAFSLIFSPVRNILVYAASPNLVSIIEKGSDELKEKNKKLSKKLLYSSFLFTKKSIEEATDSWEESWIKNLTKRNLWWVYLPSSLESRAVDPKFHIAAGLGKINRSVDFYTKKAADAKKIDDEEAKMIYENLNLINIEVEEATSFLDAINSSEDKKLELSEKDLQQYKKIKFGKIDKDGLPYLSKEDEKRLGEIGKEIWKRIYETREWKEYQKSLTKRRAEMINSKLEEMVKEVKREKIQESKVKEKAEKNVVKEKEVSRKEYDEVRIVFKKIEGAFNNRNAELLLKNFHLYHFGGINKYHEELEWLKREFSEPNFDKIICYSVEEPSIEGDIAKIYCVERTITKDSDYETSNIYLLTKDNDEWKILTDMRGELGGVRSAHSIYYGEHGKFVSSIEELVPTYIDENTYRMISYFNFYIDDRAAVRSRLHPDW